MRLLVVRASLAGGLGVSILCSTGCLGIIPSIPLNAPGYGHTYRFVDMQGEAVPDGLLVLESRYSHGSTVTIDRFPIKGGEAVVPRKIAFRYHSYATILPPLYVPWIPWGGPVYFGFLENPKLTSVRPFIPGYRLNGQEFAPIGDPAVELDGLSRPPDVLRLVPWAGNAEYRRRPGANDRILDYIRRRRAELLSSQRSATQPSREGRRRQDEAQ